MKVIRVHNVAAVTTLAAGHFSVASLKNAGIVLVLLTALASSASAFSPSPRRKQFSASMSTANRIGTHVNSRRHFSLTLYASDDDNVNGSRASQLSEGDEEDSEVDIITQKLRRNAENVINPMKEHDKMVQDNEDEANLAKASLDTNGSSNNSTMTASSALYSALMANTVDPDFDPATSTDEAYVESQFKELLSRKGAALSRLGPGIATLPLDPSSEESKSEDTLSQKEAELQQVINEAKSAGSEEVWDEASLEKSQAKQSEILEKAHKLQSEIDQMHVDDCGAVLLANLAFYESFSLQDPEAMKDVWWQSPSVICVHPSHPPLIGSNAVYESFTNMFDNGVKGRVRGGGEDTAIASGGVFMTPTNIRALSVRGTTASLVCDEEVYSKGSAGESISREGGLLVNKLLTTNVFRKISGQWKMVHRHASWHPETTAAQAAMKAEPGIVLYDEATDAAKAGGKLQGVKEGMTLRKLKGEGTSKRPLGLPSVPASLEGLDTNAVLGIPMPKEEETKKSKGSSEEGMSIGKIINLSDLLGGGDSSSSSSDKEEDKAIGDLLSDILGSSDPENTSRTGSGTPEDPFITRRVIKIGPDEVDDFLGKKNKKADDDDDEEKNVVIDLRGKSDEERKEVISQLVGNAMKDAGLPSPEEDNAEEDIESSAVDASVSQVDDEDVRQKTITTLRKLSDQGLISAKQKRVLLTDIITASSKGETSMVEVAYELLVTEDESGDTSEEIERDSGMEDFTEQCRVFAAMGEDD